MTKDRTTDALEISKRVILRGDNKRGAAVEARTQELIAQVRQAQAVSAEIRRLRTEAGLSQQELARRVKTTQSVISQLEDAEYEGHSLSMLRRVAAALGCRVVIQFAPLDERQADPAPAT